jgi:hypothetical protein
MIHHRSTEITEKIDERRIPPVTSTDDAARSARRNEFLSWS